MREQIQPKFQEIQADDPEKKLNPEEVREMVESAMGKIKEGVPENGKKIFEKGEIPYEAMYSHYANMIMASALVFEKSAYLTDEEKLLLVGKEQNILYMAGFLDRQTNERLKLRSNFRTYFAEKISPAERRRYKLAKTNLRPVQ
jgi:hypothetical protein